MLFLKKQSLTSKLYIKFAKNFGKLASYPRLRGLSKKYPKITVVQRKASGWVNWGTNGENEFPELPSGSTIVSAYGKFDNWKKEVDKMEERLSIKINQTLKINE